MNTKAIARSTAALIVVIVVLVAAFGGYVFVSQQAPAGPTATTTGPSATTTQQTVPVPGFVSSATYIAESANSFQWLDPAVSYYQYDYEVQNQVYEKLLWYNGNSSTEIIPWLAESYQQVSPTQYQFKLRQGINFQDGTPFNANAVWFSLNRLLLIDGTSGTGNHGTQAAWIVQQMLDKPYPGGELFTYFGAEPAYDAAWVQQVLALNFVQVVDPYTINVNIKNPTTQFPYLMAGEWANIVSPSFVVSHDFPSACKTSDCAPDSIDYTAYFNHIAGHGEVEMNYLNLPQNGAKAGTGPYYIDSVNPTTYEIVFKANANYWGGPSNWSGPPISVSIKTIDFLYVPDLATRILDIKAGKATAIGVSASDLYSVIDRDQWLNNKKMVSVVPGVTVYGPLPQLVTDWFNLLTNVTDSSGALRKFQPFADVRWRLAVGSSVNMTDANININNRLGDTPNELLPPGTAPAGAYDPSLKLAYTYTLTTMTNLINDACAHPLTNFVDFNGHPYPAGAIDNTCSTSNPHTIEMYVGTGDISDQRILSIMASNLNRVTVPKGVTFTIVPVPGGQYYTLASRHEIYFYWGGWVQDYNHALDWLGPMLLASGTYPAWNNMNFTKLNRLLTQASEADAKGDVAGLLAATKQMQEFSNKVVIYIYIQYPLGFAVRSSFLQGYFWNVATEYYYYAVYSYKTSQ
jgi:ABC-type transport system substrate-binding protein